MQITQTHCGQYKRYGDYFREWEITTTETDKPVVLKYLRENIYKRNIPEQAEWRRNTSIGGAKEYDSGYYFAGYYILTRTDNGFKFTVCEPWCD